MRPGTLSGARVLPHSMTNMAAAPRRIRTALAVRATRLCRLRRRTPVFPLDEALFYVSDDDETDAAHDNQNAQDGIDGPIFPKPDETVRVKGKTGIAKGADGMEHGRISGTFPPNLRCRAQKEAQRPHRLDAKGGHEDRLEDGGRGPLAFAVGEGILDQGLAGQGGPFSHHHEQQGGNRQNAQPADLGQNQNHDLAVAGESMGNVQDRQPGDATGRRRHEQGVDDPQRFSCGRGRYHQQDRADGNQYGEPQNRRPRRRAEQPHGQV